MTQPDLFEVSAIGEMRRDQNARDWVLAEVLEARNSAMATVERNAGAEFQAAAEAFVLGYLRQHGEASSEVLTDACKAAGIIPHDDRAFGPLYARLARRKQIVWVAYCARQKGHRCAGGNIWRAA